MLYRNDRRRALRLLKLSSSLNSCTRSCSAYYSEELTCVLHLAQDLHVYYPEHFLSCLHSQQNTDLCVSL